MFVVLNRVCMLSLKVCYRTIPFTYKIDAPTTLLFESLAFKVCDAAFSPRKSTAASTKCLYMNYNLYVLNLTPWELSRFWVPD